MQHIENLTPMSEAGREEQSFENVLVFLRLFTILDSHIKNVEQFLNKTSNLNSTTDCSEICQNCFCSLKVKAFLPHNSLKSSGRNVFRGLKRMLESCFGITQTEEPHSRNSKTPLFSVYEILMVLWLSILSTWGFISPSF